MSHKALELTTAYNAPSSLLYSIFVKPILALRGILMMLRPGYHSRRSKSLPLISNFLRSIRHDPKTANVKIGVCDFCWGGRYAVLLSQNDEEEGRPLVDAAFTAHPAQLSVPGDIEMGRAPLSIALAESDIWLKPPAVKQLMALEKEGLEVLLFPGTNHGFALRGDPRDAVAMDAAKRAEEQALAWFKRWIG